MISLSRMFPGSHLIHKYVTSSRSWQILPLPIAVTREDNKLVGILVKGSLLASLAKKGKANQDTNGDSAFDKV